MRNLVIASLAGLALSICAPAFSKSNGFESSISTPVTTPVKVEVVIGDDLAYRADHMPKDIRDRRTLRLNAAFANNGHYGERDLNRLAERLQSKVEKRLTREGVTVTDESATILRIVLTDAKPNRPTFTQMSKEVNLSYQSYGLGGAEFEAELIQAGGASLGNMSYRFFETMLDHPTTTGTWTDAHRAMDRFARKAAKSLQVKS